MSNIGKNVIDLIGHTPLMEITNIEKELGLNATILVKLEYLNPTGSAKDRAALGMINDAKEKGLLKDGATIIEPTSGNTGIGLASLAASLGYHCIMVMPDTMSEERRNILKAYGAEIVLTPGAEGMAGSVAKAEELAKEIPNSFIPDQFANPANANAHYTSTGPEIYADTDGNIDILVASFGTGGTITGTGRYLKEKNPAIRVIGVEPASSPLVTKGTSGAHAIQGIGANFIPGVLDLELMDEVMTINDEDPFETAKMLAEKEGISCGISSGAALHAAILLAKREENAGKTIVAILPDSGDRYYSTPLFKS